MSQTITETQSRGRRDDDHRTLDRRGIRRRRLRTHRSRLQPSARRRAEARALRLHRRRRRRRAGRGARLPEVARHLDREASGGDVRIPRAAERTLRRARGDPHERARQGALGCRGRDRARTRGRRARLRHARLHEGRVLRERLDGHRRVHAAAARRRRRHHQPVQLPGDGAAVVLPARDRDRQHGRAEAVGEGPERRPCGSRSSCRRPACPTAC